MAAGGCVPAAIAIARRHGARAGQVAADDPVGQDDDRAGFHDQGKRRTLAMGQTPARRQQGAFIVAVGPGQAVLQRDPGGGNGHHGRNNRECRNEIAHADPFPRHSCRMPPF